MKRLFQIAGAIGALVLPGFAAQWNVDPNHSSASFKVRHMMVSTVHGSFASLKGTVEYDPADLAASKANLVIDANTVDTRNENRDKDLRSPNFFDVLKFPTITFASKRIVPGSQGKFQLIGDMTIHGVTKEVTFDVEGPSRPSRIKEEICTSAPPQSQKSTVRTLALPGIALWRAAGCWWAMT